MKRSVIILLLGLFLTQSGFAQLDFGPRLNLVRSNLTLTNDFTTVTDGEYNFGIQAGLFLRADLPGTKWYLQPEILYTWSTGSLRAVGVGKVEYLFDRIEVPVLVGRTLGPIRVKAGPVARFRMHSEIRNPDGSIVVIRNRFKDVTFGYQLGAGIDVTRFVFDLKFEGSLDDINTRFLSNSLGTDFRVNQLILAVGYNLLK